MSVTLALGAALCWGVAGLIGGLGARRGSVIAVVLVGQAVGLAMVIVAAPVVDASWPGADVFAAGVALGCVNATGLAALYRAYRAGDIAKAAPLLALSPAIPVVASLVEGEQPGALQIAGIAVALAGIAIVSAPRRLSAVTDVSREALLFASISALCFGIVLLGLAKSSDQDPYWGLVAIRLGAVILLVSVTTAMAWHSRLPEFKSVGLLVVMGALDLIATAMYAVASTLGLVSVAVVLASMFPAVTVALSLLMLGERVTRMQGAGIVATFTGGALVVAG